MDNFIVNTEKILSPIASKISNQKLLIALRNSFAGFVPVIMIGSFALFLNLLIVDLPSRFGITIITERLSWLVQINNLIFNGTFGVVSLLFVFAIGFNVAKVYEVETLGGALIAFSSFIISLGGSIVNNLSLSRKAQDLLEILKEGVIPFDNEEIPLIILEFLRGNYFDTKGYFGAIVIGFLSTIIYCKLSKRKFKINLPSSIPPMVGDAFTSVIPALTSLYCVGIITYVFNKITGDVLIGWIYSFIQIPVLDIGQNIIFVVFIAFIVQFFWFFGIHGGNLFAPFLEGILGLSLLVNMEAYHRGQDIPYLWTTASYGAFVWYGTLGLLIVIFIRSKNNHYRDIAKMGIVPCIFNIGETVMYGLPTVMNPKLFIPFLLSPSLMVTVSYLATSLGFVEPVTQNITWVMPPILNGFFATGFDFGGIILSIINIGIAILVYWPFVKMADKEETS